MKQENKTETNARSSFLGILPNLNFVTATKEKKSPASLHEDNFFSHFGIHQGVQVIPRLHLFRFVALFLLGLLTSHLVGTSLIHSAYAASYVNVSSGGGNSGTSAEETVSPGIVNLGSIKPSSTGTMATGNDTLTIHTDCSAGYKVYVSGQNGKSTNLINSNAEDPTSPAASELISSMSNLPTASTSASSLNNNTWGINGNATDISSHLYYGLPSYSDATAYPLVTKSDVPEESTVPIYYGVKVNTDITPGTYTGDVLYTVIMDSTCLAYTVVFNSNGGTGTMENQSIMYNTEEELKQNTYTRSGYGFLGWSTNENGKTGNAVNGIGTLEDVEYSDLQEVNNLTTGGSTITLYAIWIKVDGNMQSWNGCSSLATNSIVRLIDTRDNKVYAVKKTPDGKCWMLQNLTANHITMTPQDTNISDGRTYYLPKKNTRYTTADPFNADNTTISSSILDASDSIDFTNTNSNQVQVGYRNQGTTDNSTGNPVPETTAYYNFYTATLGFSYYNDGKSSGSSTQDICPKGWHLPWTSDSGSTRNGNAEFYTLGLAYNSDSSAWTNYIAPGSTSSNNAYSSNATVRQNMVAGDSGSLDRLANNNGAAGFTYAGYYNGTSSNNIGTSGNYQSSSVYSTNAGYRLNFGTTNVFPQDGSGKSAGFSVRCVVDNYTISFDANGGTGTMDNQVVFGNNSSTQTIKNNTFTKTGYHFLGWSTNSSATSATYTNGQSLTSAIAENGRTIKLYAIWAPNTFTIYYNSNGGSGTTSSQTATYGTNVTLRSNGFTAPSGKKFKSWGTSSSGGTTYSAGQSVSPTTLKSNVTTVNGGSVTLYAIWETMYMQTTACSSLPTGTTSTLVDSRDNQSYTVYRWPTSGTAGTNYPSGMAGYCIMTKDLALGYVTGGSITKGANLSLSTSTSAGSGTITARTGTSNWSTTNSDSNLQYINGSGGTYNSQSYYTYGAAQKVCPKGWAPPTDSQYDNIISLVGNSATGSSTIRNAPYNFIYGGELGSQGWNNDNFACYWASSQDSSTTGRRLTINSSGLYMHHSNKYYGHTVRCIDS